MPRDVERIAQSPTIKIEPRGQLEEKKSRGK